MRYRRLTVFGMVIALVGVGMLIVSACGGGGSSGGGSSAADEVVKNWVEGWQRSSGLQRDDITAGTLRLLLTGDLRTRAQAATTASSVERLDKVYDDFMSLPFPPDSGYAIVSTQTSGDAATVVVKLTYTQAAAGAAASAGIIPFEKVNDANQQVGGSPQRTISLQRIGQKWLIAAIAE